MPQLSYWEKESFFAPQDIIIVGSGFVGLWSALHLKLKNSNCKITILESGVIPTGASTRNAGFSCFGSPGELLADAQAMGEDKMWGLVKMRYQGLLQIRQYFTDTDIDYDACGGYECFSQQSADWTNCIENLDWLNDGLKNITGQQNVFALADKKITDFGFNGFHHMIANRLEAGLHPGKLVQALLQKVQALGVRIITGIRVNSYQNQANGISLDASTPDYPNLYFYSKQLLLCTNAFTKKLFPLIDIVTNRGQVLITAPIPGLAIKGTFHFNQGYYYFRNVGDRLLLGGARNIDFAEEQTLIMDTTPIIQTALVNFISDHLLPTTRFKISDQWSGIMAMGTEKIPIIKMIEPNVFCCVRMSGMGVALAPMAAKEVITLMTN